MQLDVKTLQRNREEDRNEFLEFSEVVTNSLQGIQNTFSSIQTNLDKLLSCITSSVTRDPRLKDVPAGITNPVPPPVHSPVAGQEPLGMPATFGFGLGTSPG